MTPAEFRTMLERHDWYYTQSDDPRAYQRGFQEANIIRATVEQQPELLPIYTAYIATLHPAARAGEVK